MKTKRIRILLLFLIAFLFGNLAAYIQTSFSPKTIPTAAEGNWGLSFQQDGEPPVANASFEELKKYNAYYAEDTSEKKLYLTFDAGFENGNTPAILDALKKHDVKATFFVVGTYIKDNPDLIKRIHEEGHLIGNHTYHHPDMSKIATKESFHKELKDVETEYKNVVGEEMTKFYRPPQGKFNETNLQMAKDLGYHTFFWSLAYVDWYENDQPSKEEAFQKLLGRIHPGAIVFKWQKIWDTILFSGVLLTLTGMKTINPPKKKPSKNYLEEYTQAPLYYSTAPPEPTPKS